MQQSISPSVSIISEMITPALLIVASGSLLGNALARLSRVTDFVRKLTQDINEAGTKDVEQVHKMVSLLEKRANHAEISITCYYIGICSFVLSCLLIAVDRYFQHRLYWMPVTTTIIGVCSIFIGSAFMVGECRLAMKQLHWQVANLRNQWNASHEDPGSLS